jgi:galactokinase
MSRKRSRHVVTENERTLKAAEVMKQGDAVALGKLMNASGDSLRMDFEVTNQELDVMVECARTMDACYGARMTGAGFGGCAVALVKAGQADEFVEHIARDYNARTQLTPNIYVCQAAEGASVA